MLYKIEIFNINANDALAIKNSMVKDYGLVQDQDFVWAWQPKREDSFGWKIAPPAYLELSFCNQAHATFFQLRFAQ